MYCESIPCAEVYFIITVTGGFFFDFVCCCSEQYWDPPVQHLWGTYTNPIEAA